MRLFIPALGTRLRLTKDWQFSLLCEARNKSLWDLATGRAPMDRIPVVHRRGQSAFIHLHKGDVLTVDRIFIRAGSESYNSVTFKGVVNYQGVNRHVRFWVPLMYANEIECEVI
jgi:hypothetical protein